jgi:hypothetical protein
MIDRDELTRLRALAVPAEDPLPWRAMGWLFAAAFLCTLYAL